MSDQFDERSLCIALLVVFNEPQCKKNHIRVPGSQPTTEPRGLKIFQLPDNVQQFQLLPFRYGETGSV